MKHCLSIDAVQAAVEGAGWPCTDGEALTYASLLWRGDRVRLTRKRDYSLEILTLLPQGGGFRALCKSVRRR